MNKDIQHWAKLLHEQEALLAEMARIGDMTSQLEVYVRSNEGGNKPHFHIWDKNTQGQKFHTCVEIKKPVYFHHTGKEDVLNSKQKKSLIKFLSTNSEDFPGMTLWNVLVRLWNMSNSNMKVDPNLKMPDYMTL